MALRDQIKTIARLPRLLLLRTLVRELTGIRQGLAEQTALLARLVDHLAPRDPETSPDVVRRETGVDHVDLVDQILIQDYVARTITDTGHQPTDDEILIFLADEKTRSLHERLRDRDAEIARLQTSRS